LSTLIWPALICPRTKLEFGQLGPKFGLAKKKVEATVLGR